MQPTVKLGRIAGVNVGVHWSVLAVVALLVGGLSMRFSRTAPGYPWTAYLCAAAVAASLFVASLLAHELAHAIAARRNDIEVDGITLWLLGGVARLRSDAPTPGADFRIAAIGPVTSLLAAAAFGAMAWLAESTQADVLMVAVPSYLAMINLILAVFNAIPAAPLDGGRILRAAIWKWRGDRLTASAVAARTGRIFGFSLIAFGLLQAMSGFGGGLWWILLGLFVVTVASAEEYHARTGQALTGLKVQDIMTPNPESADGGSTIAEFLRDVALLRRHSTFPLLDRGGRLEGLVTLNRIRTVPAERRSDTVLREIACRPERIPLAQPDEPLSALLFRLTGCTDGRALVFRDDQLVGIVSPSDISRAVALHGLGVLFGTGGADLIEERRQGDEPSALASNGPTCRD